MMKSLAPAAAVGPSKPTISKNQNQKTEYASGGNRFFAWLSPKPARRHGHFNKHINESDNDDDSPSMPRQGQRQRRASFDETHQNSRGKSGDWRGRGNNMDTFSVNRMVGSGSNNGTVSRSRDTLEHSPVTRASHNSDHAGHEGGSISRPHSQPLLTVLLIRLNELLPEYCDHLSTATDALHSDGASKAVRVLEEGAKIDLTPISWTNEVSEMHAKAAPQSFSPTRATKGIVDGHTYTMAKHASLNGDYLSVPSSPSYIAFSPPIAHYPTPSNTEISTNHVENKSSMPKSAPSSPQYKKYLALKNKTMSFGKGIIAPLRSQQNPQSQMNAIAESEWERFVSPFLMLAGAEVLYGQMQHVVSPESEKRYKLGDKLGENNSVNGNVSTQKQGNEGAHNLHQSSWHMFPNALNSLLDSFKHPIPTNTASVSSIGRTNTPSEKEKPYIVSFAMQPSSPTKDNVATGKSVEEGIENIFGVQPSIPITSLNNANKRGSRRLISMYRQIREDIIIVGEYLCDPVLGARVGRAGTIDQTDHGQTTLLGQYTRSDVVTQKFPLPLLQVEELNRSSVISLSTSMSPERNHSISTKTLTHPRNKHQTNNHATSVSMVGDSHDHSLNSDDAVDGNGFHLYVPPPTPEKLREIAAISLRQTLDALIAYIDARCILVRIHAELCCAPKGPANSPFSISPSACMSPSSRNSFSDDTDHGVSKKWMMLAMQCRSILDKAPSWKMTEESMTKSAMDRLLKETKVLELALISVYNLMECNFFDCVVSTRKLRVFLSQIPPLNYNLPIMWIRCSLAGILSIMHILFSKYSPQPPSAPQPIRMGEPISRRISFPKSDDTPTKSPQSSKPSKVCSKMIDFDKLFSEFFLKNKSARPLAVAVVRKRDSAPLPQGVSRHNNGAECSNIGSSDKGEEPGRNPEITNCDEIMSWDPLYMKSTLTIAQDEPSSDSMFQRRNKEPNLLQKMRDNFSNDRESDLKPNRVINKNIKNDWPMTEWNEIQSCLDEQSDTDHEAFIASPVSAKHCVYDIDRNDRRSNLDPTGSIMTQVLSNSSPSSVGLNSSNTTSLAGTAIVGNSSNQISTSSHTKSKVKSHVHISPITGTLFFIVIQSIGDPKHVKKRTVSDEDISLFMSSMVSKICPDNLFTTNSILDAKFEMAAMRTKSTTAAGSGERAPSQSRAKLDNQLPESLWSDTGWESQRKKILNTLGIRHNNSPITAPLKSPYIKRQIGRSGGRQRKKKVKSSFNDSHLDFFLGPELSQALQY